MPRVHVQFTNVHCAMTEDKGPGFPPVPRAPLSEDEFYLRGGITAADKYTGFQIGDPFRPRDVAFMPISIDDGKDVPLLPVGDNTWATDLHEEDELILAVAAYEEDLARTWPSPQEIVEMITNALGKAIAATADKKLTGDEIINLATAALKIGFSLDPDDQLGRHVDRVRVFDLRPDNAERSWRVKGGSRWLGTDYEYTVTYRISRQDRDFAVESWGVDPPSLNLTPGESGHIAVTFRNVGFATFSHDDTCLLGASDLAAWLPQSDPRVTIQAEGAGVWLDQPAVKPGEPMTFTLPFIGPANAGQIMSGLRLRVPSLAYWVPHATLGVAIRSGRTMTRPTVETIEKIDERRARLAVHAFDTRDGFELLCGIVVDWPLGYYKRGEVAQPFEVSAHGRVSPDGDIGWIWPWGMVKADGYFPSQQILLGPRD
jgi:hypothetical protein